MTALKSDGAKHPRNSRFEDHQELKAQLYIVILWIRRMKISMIQLSVFVRSDQYVNARRSSGVGGMYHNLQENWC